MARATVLARPAPDLRRVAGDLEKVHGFCHDRGIQICAGSIFDELLTKASLLTRVQRFFGAPGELFVLFYAGHGWPGTGDWILQDEDVSLADILHLWNRRSGHGVLLIISDACYSGAWVMEAARLRSSNVVVQSSCAALERALDGVFISLWLLVQRLEVQETYALKHLESLDRHPCVYVAPELKPGRKPLPALPALGPGADPPVLLQLHSCHNLGPEIAVAPEISRPHGSARTGATRLHFAHNHHRAVRGRAEQRRRGLQGSQLSGPYREEGEPDPALLVEQLAQSDSRNDVLNLLDAACVAAAKEELRPVLSHLKLHDTLGAILLQAASTADVQVAQAALCGLWNLCGTSRGSLSSLAPLATSCVPHALKDVAHLTPEWCARVAWLMAEEPRCCEALRACDVASALRQHLQGDTNFFWKQSVQAKGL